MESALDTCCRGDDQRQGRAPCRRRRRSAKADSCCGEADPSNQLAGSEGQERSGQRRQGKLGPGRDLRNAGPARTRDHGRRFPPNQSGWPMFLALMSSFSRETEFTKFVSDETATVRSRHTSKRRRIPMPASPRRRARRNRHEARAGIVALISCCRIRLSAGVLGHPGEIISMPACTLRSIGRGAAFASRLDPLAFSGDKRGRSKAVFLLCSTEHRSLIQNLSISHATQKSGPTDKPLPSRPQKISSPLASVCPLALQLYRCSTGFPHVWRTTSVILRTPTRLVTTPLSSL